MGKEFDIKGLVEHLKSGKAPKENITFRLSKDVIKRFKASCEKTGVKPGATVEELMVLFINAKK